MYKIYCDGRLIHDSVSPKLLLVSPVCGLAVNSAGTMTFQILPNHPYYNNIRKRKSVIDVYSDGGWLFSGFVSSDTCDFNNVKTVTVQGELAYLNDSIQPYGEYHNMPVREYLQALVNNHNSQVDDFKKFTVGIVNVEDPNDSLYRQSHYEKTKAAISDKLISKLGGYICARHENGSKFIDYISEYDHVNTQGIKFGKNLIDFLKTTSSDSVANVIIPLGAKLKDSEGKDTEERLTIESVNNGKNYVEDPDSISEYGRVVDTVIYNDVTLPENLIQRGNADLASRKYLSSSFKITAVDLHSLGANVPEIKAGDLIPVKSPVHGVDDYITVSEIKIDLMNPGNSVYTMNKVVSTLTGSKLHADKVINEIKADYVKNEQLKEVSEDITEVKQAVLTNTSLIEQLPENILLEVESEYSKVTSVDYIQKLIDGTALKWSGEGPPTVGANTGMWYAIPKRIPFVMHTWGGDGKAREEHIGDIYTDILTGKKYVFRRSEGEDEDVFLWEYLEENAYLYDVSRLDMKSDAVRLSVDKLSSDVGKQSAEIVMLSDRISSKVEGSLFSSTADQLAESISQKISKGGEVISEINQSGGIITLSSNRLVINSTYFSVTADGHITATAGNIGGFYIGASYLANNTNRLNYLGEPGITPGDTPDQCVYVGTDGVSLGKKFKVTSDGVMYANQFTSEGHFAGVSGIPGGEAGTVKAAMNNANFKFYFNGSDKGGIYYGYKKIKSANYVGVTLDAEMAEVDTFHCKTNFYYRDRYFDIVDGYLRAI